MNKIIFSYLAETQKQEALKVYNDLLKLSNPSTTEVLRIKILNLVLLSNEYPYFIQEQDLPF